MNRFRALANQAEKMAVLVVHVFHKIVSLLTLNIIRDLMGKIDGQSYSRIQLVYCKDFAMPTSGQGSQDARVRAVAPWAIVLSLGFGLLLASSLAPWHPVIASTQTINVQGRVTNTDGTNVSDGVYDFVFKLYDGAGSGAFFIDKEQ